MVATTHDFNGIIMLVPASVCINLHMYYHSCMEVHGSTNFLSYHDAKLHAMILFSCNDTYSPVIQIFLLEGNVKAW